MRLRFPWHSWPATAAWGVPVWLLLLIMERPDVHHDQWARLLLLLAALVWVPLCFHLSGSQFSPLRRYVFPAAISLVLSFQCPVGASAAILTLPWLSIMMIVFIAGIDALFQAGRRAGAWATAGAQLFWIIAGLALSADRLGIRPFGFDPAIVLLTGVHFHYAGFIFLFLLGWAASHLGGVLFQYAAGMGVAAVPVTAAGITLAQLTGDFRLEMSAAALVALSGWLGASGYLSVIRKKQLPVSVRICWAILALSLIFSMALGLGYAFRPYWPTAWLNIPSMRAFHGSANALGVAGGGLVGWYLLHLQERKTNLWK